MRAHFLWLQNERIEGNIVENRLTWDKNITGVTIYIYLALTSNTKYTHIQIYCTHIECHFFFSISLLLLLRLVKQNSAQMYIAERERENMVSFAHISSFYWCATLKTTTHSTHHTLSRAKIVQQFYIWYVKWNECCLNKKRRRIVQKKNSLP